MATLNTAGKNTPPESAQNGAKKDRSVVIKTATKKPANNETDGNHQRTASPEVPQASEVAKLTARIESSLVLNVAQIG
jgi:hypothetical protein